MVLEEQRRSFASITGKMRIVCAYEEIPMSVGGIVREVSTIFFRRPSKFLADRTGGFSSP